MMKKIPFIALFAAASALSAADVIPPEICALRAGKQGFSPELWQQAPVYPMLKKARLAEEFNYMPQEGSEIRLLADEKKLCIKVEMTDSDLLSEPSGKGDLQQSSDAVIVVLHPLKSTGFFHIECTPDKRVSCTFVPGGGVIRLAASLQEFPVRPAVEISLKGTLNQDKDRDQSWCAVLTIPVQEMLNELCRRGISVRAEDGWSLMVGRKNFSRFLSSPEISGFPQPAPDFFDSVPTHARLVMK